MKPEISVGLYMVFSIYLIRSSWYINLLKLQINRFKKHKKINKISAKNGQP
jgi:hypothetical protein